MYSLSDQLEDIKARLSDGLTSSDKDFIKNNYERIVRRIFSNRNCGQCYQDAFIEMYTTFKKNGIKKMGNFKLKNGVVLQSASFSEVVTNQNITDEIAKRWLKDNPKRIGLFAAYPENWESLLKADALKAPSKETAKSSAKNAKAKTATKETAKSSEEPKKDDLKTETQKETVDTPEVEKQNEE